MTAVRDGADLRRRIPKVRYLTRTQHCWLVDVDPFQLSATPQVFITGIRCARLNNRDYEVPENVSVLREVEV